MGLGRGQSVLLMPPVLLLICLRLGTGLEHIKYVPQLSNATLAGTLTQSTFTLEQPWGQFSHLNISDLDPIWLVVAHSNAFRNFTAPQRVEDTPVPADFPQRGYYLTLMANRALYPSSQPGNQLRVLRVGNDTSCSPTTRGCNQPLPGPGPYRPGNPGHRLTGAGAKGLRTQGPSLPMPGLLFRVKFLVMSDKGPVAETEWSNDTHLLQAEAFQAAPGSRSAGAVVIIALLSVLVSVLLSVLLTLLIYSCYDTCGSTSISGQGESVCMRRYKPHHLFSPPQAELGS